MKVSLFQSRIITLCGLALLIFATTPGIGDIILSYPIKVGPGSSKRPEAQNLQDPNQRHQVNVDITAIPGYTLSGVSCHSAGWSGSAGHYSWVYEPEYSSTGYSGYFDGDVVPESTGGGGEGPPPDYHFDAYVHGGLDSFIVTPQGNNLVPVGESKEYTAKENGSAAESNWTWKTPDMPSGSTFTPSPPTGKTSVTAYCPEAGPYEIQAALASDQSGKTTACANYIPTGVQRLYAKQTNNASNWEEVEQSLPIQGGTTNSEVPVLYVPYTEDENGQSTTSVTLKAFAYPTSDFPEDSTIPDWSAEIDGQTYPQLSWDGQEEVTALQMEPGQHTISVECGNKLTVDIIVLKVDIEINNTPVDDDDAVCRYSTDPAERPTVSCRARIHGLTSGEKTIILTGNKVRFPDEGATSKSLLLPASGGWVSFLISGQIESDATNDALILAHLEEPDGLVLAREDLTVLWVELNIRVIQNAAFSEENDCSVKPIPEKLGAQKITDVSGSYDISPSLSYVVEICGNVKPANFENNIIIARDVIARFSALVKPSEDPQVSIQDPITRQQGGNDTGNALLQDQAPTPNGKIYDWDCPGFLLSAGTEPGKEWDDHTAVYVRKNFIQFTLFNGVRCSNDFPWYARISGELVDGIWFHYTRPNHSDDNAAGSGATGMTID